MLDVNLSHSWARHGWANRAYAFSMEPLLHGISMARNDFILLRPIREDDLEAVLRVQAACYPPAMQEARAVVLSRIGAAGDTSFVAGCDGQVCAYVFAYRSSRGAVTPLDAPFEVVDGGDTLYIHDLSVSPAAAGRGLARLLVERLQALARERGLDHCALVSVQDSQRFWERLGFRETGCVDTAARLALASYPAPALYMCSGSA